MSKPIIEINNISKKYKIGTKEPYYSLRDSLAHLVKAPLKTLKREKLLIEEEAENSFWAIKDVSFKVMPGEVIGIIGRNGAGKSTLLKILSQITPPTKGEIILRGRVASLLEVGTGFHPELTGKENIYLNGALLGMKRAEIKKKFDEIVEFAEISKFLDTPVKHYSSGMYTRLAFAVAAHLEPEILMVDEVLAVGDTAFQQKCLGKMSEVSKQGRTVIFVSHNMGAIKNLCSRCLFLDQGKLTLDGKTSSVISRYLENCGDNQTINLQNRTDRQGDGALRFTSFHCELNGSLSNSLISGESVSFILGYQNSSNGSLKNVRVSLGIDNELGERICALSTDYTGQNFSALAKKGLIGINILKLPLNAGRYTVTLYGDINGQVVDWISQAGTFVVEKGDFFGTGKLPEGQGSILIDHSFFLKN